jgi:hypothetical protein
VEDRPDARPDATLKIFMFGLTPAEAIAVQDSHGDLDGDPNAFTDGGLTFTTPIIGSAEATARIVALHMPATALFDAYVTVGDVDVLVFENPMKGELE